VTSHHDRGESLRKLLDNPASSYHRRFLELRKRLEPIREQLPEGLADGLTLDAVADLLRVTRNSAGHPSGTEIDEMTAYTHLRMAGGFLTKMTELRSISSAPPSGSVSAPRNEPGT
jgi:hypothetical protein